MAKDPAVLLYVQDFLVGTSLFTPVQKGHYITILCHQQQSLNGSLTENDLKNIMGKDFLKHWFSIAHKFLADGNGFYNDRMRKEIARRKKNSEAQSDRVKKRWDEYRGNTQPIQNAGNTFLETAIEIETVNGKGVTGEKEKWNSKPTNKNLEIEPGEIENTIEFIFRLKQKMLTNQQINDYWQAFKIQNFNGEKYYQSRAACFQHFRNWLKDQKNGTDKKSVNGDGGKLGTSEARIERAKNW